MSSGSWIEIKTRSPPSGVVSQEALALSTVSDLMGHFGQSALGHGQAQDSS